MGYACGKNAKGRHFFRLHKMRLNKRLFFLLADFIGNIAHRQKNMLLAVKLYYSSPAGNGHGRAVFFEMFRTQKNKGRSFTGLREPLAQTIIGILLHKHQQIPACNLTFFISIQALRSHINVENNSGSPVEYYNGIGLLLKQKAKALLAFLQFFLKLVPVQRHLHR